MRAVGLHADVIVAISRAYRTTCTLVRSGNEAFVIDSPVFPDELEILPAIADQAGFPVVGVPTAIGIYPGEIYKPPMTWTEKYFNLQQYRVHDDGGHFAPLEVPDIYVDDVRTFFSKFR